MELSRRGFRRSEPGGITHESSLLLSKIMRSLRRKGLGTSQLAAQIGVSVDELSSYLLGLVVMSVTTSTATTTDTTSAAVDGTPTRPRHPCTWRD
jgi:hypothetical protein